MGNRGADAPTGTSEPICLRHSIQASMASIRTSDGHPIGALGVCSAPDSAENLIDAIYILPSTTLHALAALIRRGNASTKKCVLHWACRRHDGAHFRAPPNRRSHSTDLIHGISTRARTRVPTLMISIDGRVDREAAKALKSKPAGSQTL